MIEPLYATLASLGAGIFGGFVSSFMAWNASLEPFDFRKHGNALIIGTLSGLAIGAGSAIVNPDIDLPQLLVQIVLTFLSAVGLDRLRSSGTAMIASKTVEKIEENKEAIAANRRAIEANKKAIEEKESTQ